MGNSNPVYPKQLESVTPAINDTSFLLSCPVTGRTQNSPLAISDSVNNSEKLLLCPLVEAFLPCVLKALDQSEPRVARTENKHFAKEPLAEIARRCNPTSTSWFLSVRETLYVSVTGSVIEHFLKES